MSWRIAWQLKPAEWGKASGASCLGAGWLVGAAPRRSNFMSLVLTRMGLRFQGETTCSVVLVWRDWLMPGLMFGSKFLAVLCFFVISIFTNTCHDCVLSLFWVDHCRVNQVYIDDSGLGFPTHFSLKVFLIGGFFLWQSSDVLSWPCFLGLEFPYIYYCRYFSLEVFPLAKHCGIASRGNHQWVYPFFWFPKWQFRLLDMFFFGTVDSLGCWTFISGVLYL